MTPEPPIEDCGLCGGQGFLRWWGDKGPSGDCYDIYCHDWDCKNGLGFDPLPMVEAIAFWNAQQQVRE